MSKHKPATSDGYYRMIGGREVGGEARKLTYISETSAQ